MNLKETNYAEFYKQHYAFGKLVEEIGNYYLKQSNNRGFVLDKHTYKPNHICITFADKYGYGHPYPETLTVNVPITGLEDWKDGIDKLILQEKKEREEEELQEKNRIKELELQQLKALKDKYENQQ